MNKNNNSLLFVSGIVLGAVIGGAMGILFAPATGEETRKELSKKGQKALKNVKKKAKEVGDKIEPALENVKKELSEKIEEVKEGFEAGIKSVNKK